MKHNLAASVTLLALLVAALLYYNPTNGPGESPNNTNTAPPPAEPREAIAEAAVTSSIAQRQTSAPDTINLRLDASEASSPIETAWILSTERGVRRVNGNSTSVLQFTEEAGAPTATIVTRLSNGALLISDAFPLSTDYVWRLPPPGRLLISPRGKGALTVSFHVRDVSLDGRSWKAAGTWTKDRASLASALDEGEYARAVRILDEIDRSQSGRVVINASPVTLGGGAETPRAFSEMVFYSDVHIRYAANNAEGLALSYDPRPGAHGIQVSGGTITATGVNLDEGASAPVHLRTGETRTLQPHLQLPGRIRARIAQAGPPSPGAVTVAIKSVRNIADAGGPLSVRTEATSPGQMGGTVQFNNLTPGRKVVSAVSGNQAGSSIERIYLTASLPVELLPGEDREVELLLGAGPPLTLSTQVIGADGDPIPLPPLAVAGQVRLVSASPETLPHFTHLSWDVHPAGRLMIYGLHPGKYRVLWDATRMDETCLAALDLAGVELDPSNREPSFELVWDGAGFEDVDCLLEMRDIAPTTELTLSLEFPNNSDIRSLSASGVRIDGAREPLEITPSGGATNLYQAATISSPPGLDRIILKARGRSEDSKYSGIYVIDREGSHVVTMFRHAEIDIASLSGGAQIKPGIHYISMSPAGEGPLLFLNNVLIRSSSDRISIPTGGCVIDIGYGPVIL